MIPPEKQGDAPIPEQKTPPEKTGGVLLGSESVKSVIPVRKNEPNTHNSSNQHNNLTGSLQLYSDDFLQGRNEQIKTAILLYDHRAGLSSEEISKLTDITPANIYVYTDRLKKSGWATTVLPRPYKYVLTDLGRAEIEKLYSNFLQTTADRQRRTLQVQESTVKYESHMELPEQIEKFREFFEINQECREHLYAQARDGNAWVNIDFSDLAMFSPELAEMLLQQPDEILKAWQIAIEKMDIPRSSEAESSKFNVRIKKLPSTVRLSSLEPEQINHLVQVEAQVLTVSERRPQMTSARFECPSCGNVLHVLQADAKFKEPSRCGCGRKGRFKMLSKERVAACTLLLVQPLTELVGKKVKPSQLKVFLKRDLTRDEVRDHLGLNSMVRIVGVLQEIPIMLREGGQSTRFDLGIEAVSVELMDHYNPTIALSPERIQQIKEDVADPKFKKRMIASFFPRHVGDENLKLQLLCMSVAMPLHVNSPEAKRQAECEVLNIIVAGDPGMGKSQVGSRVLELAPTVAGLPAQVQAKQVSRLPPIARTRRTTSSSRSLARSRARTWVSSSWTSSTRWI